MILIMTSVLQSTPKQPDFSILKSFEQQLDDVMELIDKTALKSKLEEVERQFQRSPGELNKARLGIIYHETALNLSFFSKTEYKGYAKKSFDLLTELFSSPQTTKELLPFVASYRASALSLVSAETKKLKLLGSAFHLFDEAAKKYAAVSYLPEFLRGSVAENLPWFFFSWRKFAKQDFQSIISKYESNPDYGNGKIMSFTYWAWANQHQGKRHRARATSYLDKAISLDPFNEAAREKAVELKAKLKE
jgi:hypothetical protein